MYTKDKYERAPLHPVTSLSDIDIHTVNITTDIAQIGADVMNKMVEISKKLDEVVEQLKIVNCL